MASFARVVRAVAVAAAVVAVAFLASVTAYAAAQDVIAAPADLKSVIDNLRNWLIGLLVALATLCLTVGGVRYLLAAGDPGEINKAKETLKYSAVGYAVAALAPVLVEVLKKIVGA